MDRVSKLMVFLIVAVTLPALLVAARPAETQLCTINGDIVSIPEEVEIGIRTWALLDPDPASTTFPSLLLKGSLLQEWYHGEPTDELYAPIADAAESCINGETWVGMECADAGLSDYFEYYGHVAVSKKDGRFDFDFGPLDGGEPCVSPTWENPMPYESPLCPYRLIIFYGVYNRAADEVTFYGDIIGEHPSVALVDYTLLVPPRNVGAGPFSGTFPYSPGITIQFLTDGGGGGDETEPEKTKAQCSDGEDNDGDGLIDEADPNCKKWYR
jgi:hypothetical protein